MSVKFKYSSHLALSVTLLLFLALTTHCSSKPKQSSESQKELAPYEQLDKKDTSPSVVAFEEPSDPIEGFNRGIFWFNHYLYKYFLSPLSSAYHYVLPDFLNQGISNIFFNIREPLYSLNHLLQLEFEDSAKSLGRLGINTVVGVGGFFDVANRWLQWKRQRTTLGETLASYGVGHGFYIVLPVLGPSDLLTAPTFVSEYFAHPLNLVEDKLLMRALFIYEGFHIQSGQLKSYPEIMKDKEDPYVFLRNYHIEQRKIHIEQLRGNYLERPNL